MVAKVNQAAVVQHTPSQQQSQQGTPLLIKWPANSSFNPEFTPLIKKCINKKQLQLAKSDNKAMLLAQPIELDGKFWGVLVLSLQDRPSSDLHAALRLIKWGITWLQLLMLHNNADPDTELLNLLSNTLHQKTLDESAIAAVNKLASRLKCERVSLGLVHKKTLELQAVSHCAHFDRRTHHMQAIVEAMTEAVEQRSHIHYTLETSDDKLVSRNHAELLQINQSKAVHTFILRKGEQIIGALTIEDSTERPLTASARRFLDNSSQIMAQIFFIKQQAMSGIGQRIKKKLLLFLENRFGPSHLTGKLTSITLSITLVILLLPGEHWVYADAKLESQNKRVLVSPQDGYLRDIHARPGTTVTAGDILAELDDRDLRLERRKLSSQLQQHRQEYDEAMANYDRAQAAILDAQVNQAEAQLQLTEHQLKRTQLTAPMSGLVVSDDIKHLLGAPVQQGQLLFTVADDKHYRVKLYIDERDIAALKLEQKGRLILTSLPATDLHFTVSEITPLSDIREGRNYFVVEGILESNEVDSLLRPGMTGSGKVFAGKRRLGWVWFHDIFNALRVALWV